MKVKFLISMVYVNASLEPITLQEGKVYEVPDSWGSELVSNACAVQLKPLEITQ